MESFTLGQKARIGGCAHKFFVAAKVSTTQLNSETRRLVAPISAAASNSSSASDHSSSVASPVVTPIDALWPALAAGQQLSAVLPCCTESRSGDEQLLFEGANGFQRVRKVGFASSEGDDLQFSGRESLNSIDTDQRVSTTWHGVGGVGAVGGVGVVGSACGSIQEGDILVVHDANHPVLYAAALLLPGIAMNWTSSLIPEYLSHLHAFDDAPHSGAEMAQGGEQSMLHTPPSFSPASSFCSATEESAAAMTGIGPSNCLSSVAFSRDSCNVGYTPGAKEIMTFKCKYRCRHGQRLENCTVRIFKIRKGHFNCAHGGLSVSTNPTSLLSYESEQKGLFSQILMVVNFEIPQRAVTPGQVIALYDDEVCLGGAVIQPTVYISKFV